LWEKQEEEERGGWETIAEVFILMVAHFTAEEGRD